MAFGHGGNGVLKLDNSSGALTNISSYVTGADLLIDGAVVDVTALAASWREVMPSTKGAVLTVRGHFDPFVDSILWNALLTTRTFELYPLGASNPYFTGEVYGVSYRPASATGRLAGWEFTAVVTGTLTRNSSLISSLMAYYSLEESSGTRADAHGSNHLTDNNTVTQTDGITGKCAQFTRANTEYLSCVDNAALKFGPGVACDIDCWVKLTSKASPEMTLVSKNGALAAQYEYSLIYRQGTDRFGLYLHNGTSLLSLDANSFGSPSTGVWYYVRFGWNPSTSMGFIQVNNGPIDTGALSGGIQALTNNFTIGAQSLSGQSHDGLIDEVGIWKRIRTDAEIAARYNSGVGNGPYPF